jgi:hypothetical protein
MATTAQITANQANAQHSTGPNTAQGKARSAQNARKHGLTAKDLVIRPEEQDEFDQYLSELAAELDPRGALEQTIFDQLVHAAWNMRRTRRLEAENAAEQNEAESERLARYYTRAERLFHRARKALQELQTNRYLHTRAGNLDNIAVPPLADMTKRTRKPTIVVKNYEDQLMDDWMMGLERENVLRRELDHLEAQAQSAA